MEDEKQQTIQSCRRGNNCLEKACAFEDHALNIGDILIDYWTDDVTNSDSGKPTYGIIKQMFPETKDEVAKLIFQEFLDATKQVNLRKST
uniref:GLOBIN domain-containing protein n=1 Tax=Rhabditophanes sp. KR3021 TaxID=114890 RepID=A0AC35UH05_9BILA